MTSGIYSGVLSIIHFKSSHHSEAADEYLIAIRGLECVMLTTRSYVTLR